MRWPAGRERRDLVLDAAIALAAFAVQLAVLAARSETDARELDALGVGLAALSALPLVLWRRSPLAIFAVTAAASAALNGLGYPPGPPVGPTVALFLVGLSPEGSRTTGTVVAGLFAAHLGAVAAAEEEFPTVPLLFGALVWGGAWVIGDRVRGRRERITELEERARRTEQQAARDRRLAVAEERTRIARELHDAAGHAINVILVQAGAARLLQEQDPERAKEALETIEEVARETIGEIDQLVRVLRDDTTPDAAIEPLPGLSALDALIARQDAAGLATRVNYRGRPRRLPAAVDRTAFRIVQEALTNAARHGAGTADVELGFGPTSLEITVSNPTANGAEPVSGHGIVGMQERAALVGGTLEAGAHDGRFLVSANLPYEAGDDR
ncbi:MAG TPA: histidine kinase [Gaiellaceae bacterium]|nr:histidine kinase [Gaiellaceae bacterium]